MTMKEVVPLSEEHFEAAVAQVAQAGLPTEDLVPGQQRFWGAWEAGTLVGVIAAEGDAHETLVRSFAVDAALRGRGLGTALYRALEEDSRTEGVARLVLLTETAKAFFLKQGFVPTDRAQIGAALRATKEFTELCPASAVCLTKTLSPRSSS